MAMRPINLGGGPAALPLEALRQAQIDIVDLDDTGMSVVEHSHRDAPYERVHDEALQLLRELLKVPDTHEVLLMQGGARAQFALLPMNFLLPGQKADYVTTGTWAHLAHQEAKIVAQTRSATARVALDVQQDKKFFRVPTSGEVHVSPTATYLHVTSNNTLFGTQWENNPRTMFPEAEMGSATRMVVDMTSDLLARPLDVSRFGLIYAGAQKNLGPAGVTVVIVERAWLSEVAAYVAENVPSIFRYSSFAETRSLFNTPPTFAVYLMRNTLRVWKERGLESVFAENKEKAKLLYQTLEDCSESYRLDVEKDSRSLSNVVFRVHPSATESEAEREKRLIATLASAGIVNIKGHRSVGGLRASIYNAIRLHEVEKLCDELRNFR